MLNFSHFYNVILTCNVTVYENIQCFEICVYIVHVHVYMYVLLKHF